MNDTPDRWTEEQKTLYTRVLRFMETNGQVILHPSMPPVDPAHLATICHNAAFVAAEMLEHNQLRIIDDEGRIVAESPQTLNS